MEQHIQSLREQAAAAIQLATDISQLEAARIDYLGRKGKLTALLKQLGTLSAEARPPMGNALNKLKEELTTLIDERLKELSSLRATSPQATVDGTLPGRRHHLGTLHPLTQIIDEIQTIFMALGFSIAEGPEVETEYNNFEALNIPTDHPSRESFDTFYITDDLLLRSHTSPVQIRQMKEHEPPLRILSPGKAYRPDAVDASHSFMFHQVEGFAVDKDITFADLKGVMGVFVQHLFGEKTKMRFRPHFFPFTEPSVEIDISCIICRQKGCRVCSHTGWLEILGAGMIHPTVLRAVDYDTTEWQGFAFGMGVERIAMLKYGVDDIRLFTENDTRFIRQFK